MHLPALHLPYQSLVVILLIGLVAGWIAAKFMTKYGMGIVGDVIVGAIVAYIGNWLASARRSLRDWAGAPQSERHGQRYRPALAGSFNQARLKETSASDGQPAVASSLSRALSRPHTTKRPERGGSDGPFCVFNYNSD